jgi:hypothetical protein
VKRSENIPLVDIEGMRAWIEDSSPQPRHSNPPGGVDHGSTGIVLAEIRVGNEVDRRLVWFKGSMTPCAGVRGFGRRYSPAHLEVITGRGYPIGSVTEGGRITYARIQENAETIDRLLGAKVSHLVDPRHTLVLVREATA